MIRDALVSAIRGAVTIAAIIAQSRTIMRHIFDPPRRRKPQMATAAAILG